MERLMRALEYDKQTYNEGYRDGYAVAKKEIDALRNELCAMCGKYKTAHLGSCDGCRWKEG